MAQRLVTALALAGTAQAHQGVRTPAVLERMNNMFALADEMEILVNMARGTRSFDAPMAEAALKWFSI
jgi:cytochrome c556